MSGLTVALALACAAQTGAPRAAMYPVSIDQDRLSGAVDFSGLNHPLTAADRLRVKDGHFVNARGERVRLWGVNLAFGANFPEEQDAARIAKRLRRLGVNLVRLHHMDTSPDAQPETARSLLTTGPYPALNPVSVRRLRVLLDALKAEGIYVNLNLHVGYRFRPEVDGVEGPVPAQSKPLHIMNPRMVELQREYARKVIEALKLKGDPVLGMVEIDNEASVLFTLQGKDAATLLAGIDVSKAMELDRAYLEKMRDTVWAALGEHVPVAGTQVEFGGPLTFDTHAGLDYHDDHFYIDHYNFPNRAWDTSDWRMRDSSGAGTGFLQYLNKAFAREAGKPFTVSEFNQPYPNRQGAELDPALAAFASFQDWDGVMHFAYEHGREWDRNGPSGFNLNGDFTKLAAFGQAGYVYRKGLVRAGVSEMRIALPREMREQAAKERQQFNLARFFGKEGVDPNVAFTRRVSMDTAAARRPARVEVQGPYVSDTGELTYDAARKLMLVAAPQAAGVFGFAGTEKARAGAVELELAEGARGFAALLVTALDGRRLEESRRMLVTNPGYTLGEKQRLVNYGGAADWFTLAPLDGAKPSSPFTVSGQRTLMEKVAAVVTLRSRAKKVTVYPLDGTGRRLAGVEAEKTDGGFRLKLDAEAPWYELAAR